MGGYGSQLLLVLVLVLLNAAFAGSEMALITLRESQIRRLERSSKGGRVLARLSRDPNRFLATIQIGITVAGFLASAVAAVSLAAPLVGPLGFLGAAAEPVAVVLVTLALTYVTLVLGELAPKRLAMQRAEGWALAVARPLDWLAAASRPAVWLLGRSTDLVVRLLGGDPGARRTEVSAEEIRDLVAAQRGFTPQQREIVSGAFEIGERRLREILVPRRKVTTLAAWLPADEAMRVLARSGHTRAPVVGRNGLDDVVGVVHLRDLLEVEAGTAGERARPPVFMPETLSVSEAMRQLRQQREQLALIVDERGAIDGIVTMEDLVEEVVGEIYDESDRDVETVVREAQDTLLLPGTFPIHDLVDVGVDLRHLREPDYTTVAGLVLAELNRIPTGPGDLVRLPGFTIEVVEVVGRAITKVRIRTETGQGGSGAGPAGRLG